MFVLFNQFLGRMGWAKLIVSCALVFALPNSEFHLTTAGVQATWHAAVADTVPVSSDQVALTLDKAIAYALQGNPGLAEIKARAEALASIPAQAGALDDPTVNFDMLNVPTRSFNLRKEDMTMMELGISQALPFPGKLALREKIAKQEALAASDSVDEARLRLVRDVKQNWWRLYYYDQAALLLNEAEQFFLQLIEISQAKYQLGKGTQQDVLLAQMELSKLKDEKLDLISMRHSLANQFNVLLDKLPEKPVIIPHQVDVKLPDLTESVLQEKALRTRPLFAQHQKMLDAAVAKVDLAKRNVYPDFTVGAGYAVRQNSPTGEARSDFASVRLSMNLPIYAGQKQHKAIDQRQSELLQERYALQDEHHKIQAEIASKAAEYQHAKEKLQLLENEIIPQAQQTVNSLLAGYQVSQSDFSDLLRTQLSYLQYQTQYWQVLTNSQQLLADLSADIGEELTHD